MKLKRGWHVAVLAALLGGTGCTVLREIPRADYVERVPERSVRVVTRAGDSYELETARIEADSLVGYRRRDVEGVIEEFETLRVPLDDVVSISARRVDWYRTGLIGVAAATAIAVLAARANSGEAPGATGGGKEPPPLP